MDASPLNKIPGELRNRIYELVLTDEHDEPINVCCMQAVEYDGSPEPRVFCGGNHIRQLLAITKTCKQIRSESAALFYFVNSFEIGLTCEEYNNVELFNRFATVIGEDNAKALRQVKIQDFVPLLVPVLQPDDESVGEIVAGMIKHTVEICPKLPKCHFRLCIDLRLEPGFDEFLLNINMRDLVGSWKLGMQSVGHELNAYLTRNSHGYWQDVVEAIESLGKDMVDFLPELACMQAEMERKLAEVGEGT